MPGLSFLAKKKWHTSNIKNVEKVWVAEQKDEQERKRLAEFQKQLLEERQIQELRQLQAAQGQVVKHTDNSLDWMYEGPGGGSQVQKDSEEYLLGKIYKPQQTKTFEVGAAPIAAQESSSSNSWVSKVANKNDIFSRKHEDPMIAIKQAEKAQRDKVVNNPLQMERIRQSVAKHLEETEYEKDREARARMELRERMERDAKREDLEDDYSDDDRSHRKGRKHKKKHHKKDKKKSKKERRHHSDSESSSDSDDDRRESSRRSKRSRSRDPYDDREVDEKRQRHSGSPEPQRVIDRPAPEPAVPSKPEENMRSSDDFDRRKQPRAQGDEDRGHGARENDDRRRRSPDQQYQETNRSDRGSRRDSRDRDRERERDRSDRHRRTDSRDKESRHRRDHSRDRDDRYRRDRSPDYRRDSRDRDRVRPRSNSRSRDHLSSSSDKRSDSSRVDHRQNEFGRSRRNDDDHREKPAATEKSSAHEESNTTSLAGRKSWGLVKGGSSSNAGDGLGPSAELLKRKEEEKLKEEQQRQENLRRARGGGSARNVISEEERLARLRAMQQDAEVIDVTRVVRNKTEAADDKVAHDSVQVHAGKSAEFIHDMRSEVLRSAGDSMSMKDRLDTHRHYVQKGAALDDSNTSNFLRR